MDSNNYYYYGGIDLVQSYNPTSATNFTFTLDKYSQTVFLLGLRGFSGFTALTGCYWGWSITSVNNDIATLTISQKQLQYLQYSFFQIGKYTNSTNSSETTTTTSGSSSYIGIIVGIVVGIVITTVVIITFLKFYWKRAILNLPTHDDFKQMPSISL